MLIGQNISSDASYRNNQSHFWLDTIPNILHPHVHEMTSSKTSTNDSTRDQTNQQTSSAGLCCSTNQVEMFMFTFSILINCVL